MFKKTRLRLTLLNALVLSILLSALGSIIYLHMKFRLFQEVDQSLIRQAKLLQLSTKRPLIPFPAIADPTINILIWGPEGKLDVDIPETSLYKIYEREFQPTTQNQLTDITVENFHFRTFSFQIQSGSEPFTVQLVKNVDTEINMLQSLLLIIMIGCVIGSILSFIAGLYLADKALIPIQASWGKQQQFVADASHELRTPLSVIQSRLEHLLRSPAATVEEKASDISIALKESRRLTKLIGDLLTLARSDSNTLEIQVRPFPLNRLIQEIADHYQEIAEIEEKKIVWTADTHTPFIGDPERIHQLLVILLDNAMKYTQEGGIIWLSCHSTPSQIALSVEDNGIGIDANDLPHVFDRFYRGDQARTLSNTGTGLGLSIAQWIVEKHHGTISIASEKGKGTKVTVIFKKKRSHS